MMEEQLVNEDFKDESEYEGFLKREEIYMRAVLTLAHAIYDHVYNDRSHEYLIETVEEMLTKERIEYLEHLYKYKDMYKRGNMAGFADFDAYEDIDTSKLNDVEEMKILD